MVDPALFHVTNSLPLDNQLLATRYPPTDRAALASDRRAHAAISIGRVVRAKVAAPLVPSGQ